MPSMYIVDWAGHPEVAEMIRLQKAGVRPSGDYALSPMSEGEDKEGEGDKTATCRTGLLCFRKERKKGRNGLLAVNLNPTSNQVHCNTIQEYSPDAASFSCNHQQVS